MNIPQLVVMGLITLIVPPGLVYSTFKDAKNPGMENNGCGSTASELATPIYVDSTSFFGYSESLKPLLNDVIAQARPGRKFELWTNDARQRQLGPAQLLSFCKPPSAREEAKRLGFESGSDRYYQNKSATVMASVNNEIDKLVVAVNSGDTAQNSPILEALRYFLHQPYEEMILMSDAFQLTKSRQFCLTKNHMPPRTRTDLLLRESLNPELTRDKEMTWIQPVVPGRQGAKPFCFEEEATRWWLDHFDEAELNWMHFEKPLTAGRGAS